MPISTGKPRSVASDAMHSGTAQRTMLRGSGSIRAMLAGLTPPTRHPGSKPGYVHLSISSNRGRLYQAADGRMAEGQKCVPPAAKVRKPAREIRPLSATERSERYCLRGPWTSAKERRVSHKLNHAAAKAHGGPVQYEPLDLEPRGLHKTPAGTLQPRSGAPSRGFLKMLGRLRPADRDRAMMLKGWRPW